jgi:hypothetical protein
VTGIRSKFWLMHLKASQTSRFEMSNGFALVMRLPPSLVGRLPEAGYRCPFGPAPLQDFQPYCAQCERAAVKFRRATRLLIVGERHL